MKYLIFIFLIIMSLGLNSQDCTICPEGSAVTLDGSSYPATATFFWSCTNNFSSTLQSPTFYPEESTECTLTVTEGPCTSVDVLEIEVCDCSCNNPCLELSFDEATNCVTLSEIGDNCDPLDVDTDIMQWKEEGGAYENYTGPICGCDVYDYLEVSPKCDVFGSYFRFGGNAAQTCDNGDCKISQVKVEYPLGSGPTIYPSCSATFAFLYITEAELVANGSSVIFIFEKDTDWGTATTTIKFVYNEGGLACSNVESYIIESTKVYKDIFGKRVVTYTNGCPEVECEIEIDIPQTGGDPCLLNSYITEVSSSSCSPNQEAYFANYINATGAVTYQWTFNGSNIAGETDALLCVGNLAPGEYCVYIEDSEGCQTYSCKTVTGCTLDVTITEASGELTANLNNCNGTPTYQWYEWVNSSWVAVGTNSATYDMGGVSGLYKCDVICSGDNCEDWDEYEWQAPCSISIARTATQTYTTAYISGCNGTEITYKWSKYAGSGNNWILLQTTVTTSTSDIFYPPETNNYLLQVWCNGCYKTTQFYWVAEDPCEDFSISMYGYQYLCVGDSYTYGYAANNGTSPYTQTWELNGSYVAGTSTYSLTPASAGTFTISVDVVDSEGCEDTDLKVLYVDDCCDITVDILPSTATVCENETQSFFADANNGAGSQQFEWTSQISGGPIISQGSGNPKVLGFSLTGSYNIAVTVTDAEDCEASDNATLIVQSCSSCECEPEMVENADCDLEISFSGAGCVDFDWTLQYSLTGFGWTTIASGGPPCEDFTYDPNENGWYRLTNWSSSCGANGPIDVQINCACVPPLPQTVYFDDGAGGNPKAYCITNNNLSASTVNGCDGEVDLWRIHGIDDGETIEVSVTGNNITLTTPSTQVVDPNVLMVGLLFSNVSSGETSYMTVTYCNTDYVFPFIHDCP